MNTFNCFKTLFPIIYLLLLLFHVPCDAQLSTTFYDRACPNASAIVRASIQQAILRERRMAASLIRLHFHYCFVQGCDASILLNENSTIQSEKTAFPNVNSVRGYEVIEAAKREVERVCPGVVSCADILTLAARDASVAVSWGTIVECEAWKKGLYDSQPFPANTDLPSPSAGLDALISSFANKGLSARDMVALSGAHTIGQAQCFLFRSRINSNAIDIDARFASIRRRQCPQTGGDSNLAPLDLVTPNSFDNNYFKNLMQRKGLLQSDQVLFNGGSTDSIVSEYSRNPRIFASDFGNAMIKMGEIQPLVGRNGIIRRTCSAIN
ncbi:UNVERIFIED_CONTAM: Lignin-forming anionic peroxidase [Sesamum angustifolium]|uniref:Peroxidase n=1 Tax=Sesamum angustifolium TaxID=2727405 RepID=A0AAW2M5S7_9LAMI